MARNDSPGWLPTFLGRVPAQLSEPERIEVLGEVFGIQGGQNPRNYVERPGVDDPIRRALWRRRPVVIYGSSKQGKTCVRRAAIPPDESIVLSCQQHWSAGDINKSILRGAGYVPIASQTAAQKHDQRVSDRLDVKGKALLLEAGLNAEASLNRADELTNTINPEPVDLNDVNQVISKLKELDFQKVVVLEEFHVLPIGTQKRFAQALKAFFDDGTVRFAIIGVWRDSDRLIHLHGDLAGRIDAVDVDKWNATSIRNVIQSGADILKIRFDPQFAGSLVAQCVGSVWIVQEVCYRACARAGVLWDGGDRKLAGAGFDVSAAIADIVGNLTSRYTSFIREFTQPNLGLWPDHSLAQWVVALVIIGDSEQLENGLSMDEIIYFIEQSNGARAVDRDDLTQVLLNVAAAQVKIGISPPVIDYIHNPSRLDIVDRAFFAWRNDQTPANLLEDCGLPAEFIRNWANSSRSTGRHRA